MEELTKAQKSRNAIRNFEAIANALTIRGFYRPSGRTGRTMEQVLRTLSPEIYGSMNDSKRIELNGLEYVIDRLPRGIESCNRIVLTAQEEFKHTPFEPIQPPKRRRISYMVSEKEICFVVTRGLSEIYDILTHLTFLNIEARKVYHRMTDDRGRPSAEWKELEAHLKNGKEPKGKQLDQALWDLSILIGRTFQETRGTYHALEKNRQEHSANSGLFKTIHSLGHRMAQEKASDDDALMIYFTPALQEMIGHQRYGEKWAMAIKTKLGELGLAHRPLHIISANMHSVLNMVYAFAACGKTKGRSKPSSLVDFIAQVRDNNEKIKIYAAKHGFYELPDSSGTQIDCQIIDTAKLNKVNFHPDAGFEITKADEAAPVIVVMDYAFGTQAFEVMDELLDPQCGPNGICRMNVESVSVMGKAGILPGKKSDIMLATAFIIEGTADNYILANDIERNDFDEDQDVYSGPMLTVLGTSLQNKDVLERFHNSSWQAVGLEMEGGHYQRAIGAAIIRGHIPKRVKVRYAYYASDNPLLSGETLASGSLGEEGVRPTYMITKVFLEKILR